MEVFCWTHSCVQRYKEGDWWRSVSVKVFWKGELREQKEMCIRGDLSQELAYEIPEVEKSHGLTPARWNPERASVAFLLEYKGPERQRRLPSKCKGLMTHKPGPLMLKDKTGETFQFKKRMTERNKEE